MTILKGRDLYSKARLIDPIDKPLQDKNGEDYWRMSIGKTVLTVREEVATTFSKGEIAEMSFEEGSREVEIEGVNTTVVTFAYAGHLTYALAKAITQNEGELIKLENSYLVQPVVESERAMA